MAFAGLKKKINKANQYVTEKMGGAEGTKLDMDFMEMERKTDVTVELVEELQLRTKEFLQPNPTARAKMAAVKGISKLSGQAKSNTYPQPEGILADCMLTYGKKLGEDGIFACALIEFGEALKQMADVKYSLDDNIKQNVLEPLHHLQTKDLKEVMYHRKKLQGRRLDFDCKRRQNAKPEDVRGSEEKFEESLQAAQMGMFNLLDNDTEPVSQLVVFCEALYDYHSQCADMLKVLQETLQQKREEAENRPRVEFVPKSLNDLELGTHEDKPMHLEVESEPWDGGKQPSPCSSPVKSPARTPTVNKQPCCQAIYDFEPENPGELGFKENDIIHLLQRVDENWYEGTVNGRTGYFPQSYVQIVVPLPN